MEIKLKYYNSNLGIGFNTWKEVYNNKSEAWLTAKEHNGRIVYGNDRIPYTKIKLGIDIKDFIAKEDCPF